MKKLASVSLCLMLCAVLLTGCGTKLEADSSLVYVDKKGGVIAIDVEELAEDYYDAEGLNTFVSGKVEEYTQENGKGSVKLNDIAVESGIAKMKMTYKTAADYSKFNEIELYQGKIVNAMAAGYDFDADFAHIENGVVTGYVDKSEVMEQDELKVVVIQANTDLKVEGEIVFVSCENVKLTGKDSISIREDYTLLEDVETEGAGSSGESVNEGTEAAEETEQVIQGVLDTDSKVAENGFFRTEVYTYVVYK